VKLLAGKVQTVLPHIVRPNQTGFVEGRALYKLASSTIKVNGTTGSDFPLERSVRQGCPLAPYLFILATDVLGYLMADPKYEVEGLSLPKGGLIRDQTFADDTALYFRGTTNNMDKAQRVLKIFC
jgi:hypothetical protein